MATEADSARSEAEQELSEARDEAQRLLSEATVRKVIVRAPKLVNIVV